ncbi:PAAR domain-containing protein [Variovorax sp. OV329]|uniref:PAAR domain-containing protein n=1 Tax=Variovorax sp. OV329 TaxID=1882825 RepID=UPI0034A114FC
MSCRIPGEPHFNKLSLDRNCWRRDPRGGAVVSASSKMNMDGREVALVGDVVNYPDGREESITSGAGIGAVVEGRSAAVVGSHVSGGDRIVSTPVQVARICIYEELPVSGFLIEGFRQSK